MILHLTKIFWSKSKRLQLVVCWLAVSPTMDPADGWGHGGAEAQIAAKHSAGLTASSKNIVDIAFRSDYNFKYTSTLPRALDISVHIAQQLFTYFLHFHSAQHNGHF